jgi:hypothetical protein
MDVNLEVPMKRTLIPAAVAAAFLLGDWPAALQHGSPGPSLVATASAQSYGYDDSAYQDFYDQMSPYGRWVVTAQWGHVWTPNGVPRGWRPYTDGHWAYADQYGWTWVSDYEWGWAPFHYGRWAFDPNYGWVWVPGRVWGPAWVSFRSNDEYIGWAPLPPQANGYDYDNGYDYNYQPPEQAGWWAFVRRDRFDAPRIGPQLVVVQQNTNIIHVTKNITNIKVVNNYGVNKSFDDQYVARYTKRPVQHYQPVQVGEDQWHKGERQQQGNKLVVVRTPDEGKRVVRGPGNNNDRNNNDQGKPQDQAHQQQDRQHQQDLLKQQQIQQDQARQQQDRQHQQELLKQQQIQQDQARQQQDRKHQQELLKQQQIQQDQARQQQDRQHQQELLKQQQIQQDQARQQQDRKHQQELLKQQQIQQDQARQQQKQLQQQQKQQAQQRDQARRQQEAYRQQQQQQNDHNDHNRQNDNNKPPKHGNCNQPGQGSC